MMRIPESSAGRRRPDGVAAVEMALVLPFLLILLFAVIDFGRAIYVHQILTNVSREAANLSSRGTALSDALAAVLVSAAPLDIGSNGYLILSEVTSDLNGRLTVSKRVAKGGKSAASRIGAAVGSPATLPATPTPIPRPGQNLHVAEVFYQSAPLTPLGNLLDISIGDTFYDAAFF